MMQSSDKQRLYLQRHLLTSVRVASSMAHSSQNGKSTTCKSKSNMSTCASLSFVVIFGFKVGTRHPLRLINGKLTTVEGLTEDHPTLTTYFEGEIIGSKYSFYTQHENWGANSKVDLSHWAKFTAFRPFQKQARKGPVTIRDAAQRETIFMRWKEHFLVPDHRVRTITGASFEGFYYICFNQVKGEVSGIYFHSKSEKLVLNPGCIMNLSLTS